MHPLNDDVYWHHYADVAQVASAAATTLGLLIAAVAAMLVLIQIYFSIRQTRENQALDTYRDYLKLCIEYPELSSSEATLIHLERDDFGGIDDEDLDIEAERALWFLSYVLHTMEQIVSGTGTLGRTDEAWLFVVKGQLGYHTELLRQFWPDWASNYGVKLRRIVEEVLARLPEEDAPGNPTTGP